MNARSFHGFTLVEIILVIFVVSILFATSFPQFQNAGIASKVAQTKMDHLYLKSGLQAYFADWRGYPNKHDPDDLSQQGLKKLTSPIPYIGNLPLDPFSDTGLSGDPTPNQFDYEAGSGCPPRIPALDFGWPNRNTPDCIHAYLLMGLGPDQIDSTPGNDEWPHGGSSPGPQVSLRTYSPTNGAESRGDIYRMMGAFAQGYFWLDDTIIGHPQPPRFKSRKEDK